MPSGDVKQDRPADRIKGLLAVVVPAFGLLRVGERDAKFFQRFFLLGTQFPVAVLTVKDVPLMDVGRPLVQMERPVQDVDMGTEAAFKFLIELIDNGKERIRRNGFSHRADLVDAFLRAGLVVFQQVLHGAVAFGVPCFLISGVLRLHMVRIMLIVVHPLDFLEAEIRLLRVLPELVCCEAPVDMIREQNGLEEERYLYRNTVDDGNVLVDYGFEGLTCTNTFEYENGISKSFGNYALNTAPDAENLFFGNVYGASEHFWSDMMIYDGETDPNVLKQKMLTGEYVIIGDRLDRLSGGPKTTSLSEQLQIGDSISFYRDGELVKTCTILAKACTVGTEDETPTTTTATMHIGGDAPFVYLPDTVFKQIYTTPTLLNYGFNMDASLHPQMEDFLSSYVEKNPSVTYTSTKLLKEQLNSVASMVWVVGSLIGCIMALAGLINFTNMIITNIITRRHEFATMQSIGMTNRQLQRLMVYEGVYYAAGADIIGGVVALLLAVTVLKNVLNSPSMWFFTLHITLVPALVIGVLYLLLAAVIPLIVLHFFNKGTVVERLRTSE